MQDNLGGMLALEAMASGDSAVHRLHPISKLIVTAAYIIAVVSVGRLDYPALSPFFFYPALVIPLSGVPAGALLRRALPALPLVLLAGLSNVFFEPAPYLMLGSVAVSRGAVSLVVLTEKAMLTVLAVLMLMATTPAPKLFAALRGIGVPKILLTLLMLSERYLTLLSGEAGRMARAYRLRSGSQKGIRMRDMGSFAGQLLLRSVDRAERVYRAMKARGYRGEFFAGDAGHFGASSALYAAILSAAMLLVRFAPWASLF